MISANYYNIVIINNWTFRLQANHLSVNFLLKKIHYDYYDLDDIVKNDQDMTLEEFVNTGTLFERDQLRCNLLNALHYTSGNKVVAVTPISYIDGIKSLFNSQDVLSIYLYDSVENIFEIFEKKFRYAIQRNRCKPLFIRATAIFFKTWDNIC